MNPEEFFAEVEARAQGTAAHKFRALADLRDLLNSGVTAEDLGDPAEYAAMVFQGEDNTARYSRVWDPMNRSILVPRVVGLGWDINLGAVAVKLGWLRPDDSDCDVIGAIPEKELRLSTSLPTVGAGLALIASAIAVSRSPNILPSGWNMAFRPNRYSSAATALAPGVIMSLTAAIWTGLAPDRHDHIARNVFGTSLSFLGAGTSLLAARSTWVGDRAQPVTGIVSLLLAPPAMSLVAGLLPIRAGLRAVWKEAGLRD